MRFNFSSIKERQLDFIVRIDKLLDDVWVVACKKDLLRVLTELSDQLKEQGFTCFTYLNYWQSICIKATGISSQELGKAVEAQLKQAGYTVRREKV